MNKDNKTQETLYELYTKIIKVNDFNTVSLNSYKPISIDKDSGTELITSVFAWPRDFIPAAFHVAIQYDVETDCYLVRPMTYYYHLRFKDIPALSMDECISIAIDLVTSATEIDDNDLINAPYDTKNLDSLKTAFALVGIEADEDRD